MGLGRAADNQRRKRYLKIGENRDCEGEMKDRSERGGGGGGKRGKI
jgi:hypothetical protein